MDAESAHDLSSLSRNALAVFRGTVTASGVGFADGDPATLLAIQVEKTIKRSPELAVGNTLYVAFPVAEFSVNGIRICKSDERLTAVPRVGDTVLILPLSGPLNQDRDMVYLYDQEMIVQRRDGTLDIPGKWGADSRLGKAYTLREVEAAIRKFEKPAGVRPREEGQR